MSRGPERRLWPILLALAVLLIVWIRSAWLSDDAYITFRVVDNLWNGYGLRWNTSERVWVYTNPLMLWLMAAAYPFTHEFYYTSIVLDVAASLAAAFIVLAGLAPNALAVGLAAAVLATSKAFVDYTTSGLEQCLTYPLLAAFYWLAFRGDPRSDRTLLLASVVAGLAALNRMDTILLFLPLLAVLWWPARTARRAGLVAAGFLPFALWEVFCLVYYGTPVPNTAYAKLSTGLPTAFYLHHGLAYFANSLRLDPVTLPTILVALLVGLAARRARPAAAALGILLYLLYLLTIGGDFMTGRHFSGPLLASVALLCVEPPALPPRIRLPAIASAVAAILLVAALAPLSPPRSGADYGMRRPELQAFEANQGIADERAYYYPATGLLRAGIYAHMPAHPWRALGEELRRSGQPLYVTGTVGFVGAFAGPNVHIVDPYGVTDAFLAQLPVPPNAPARIGHMARAVPPDYLPSIMSGGSRFSDPGLAQLYDSVHRIASGPIWDRQRWRSIVRLLAGRLGAGVDLGAAPESGSEGG